MNIKSHFRASTFRYIVLVAAAALIVIDQLIKYLVVEYLSPIGSVAVWDGVLRWTYVENDGAAFGIFAGRTGLLVAFTCIWLIALIVLLFSKIINSKFLMCCIGLIVGGGIGNLIDRIAQQYVVDYIHVELFNFAIFNFADCCVVVGTILMLVYCFFFDKEDSDQMEKEKSEQITSENKEETSC